MNVYDFDGTIYNGDSSIDFYVYCLKKNKKIILYLPKQMLGIIKYKLGKISKTEMKAAFFSFLNEIDQIDETVKNFWDIHQKKMMKWYFDQKKDSDLIISASPEFLLREICEREHITHLIASDVDKYTGVFYSENCHDKMKVVYFKEKFPNGTVYEFYSDSKSDEPMGRIANKAFLVKRGAICSWSVGGDL